MGYLSFDVDRIQSFVIEVDNPTYILGASALVKDMEEDGKILKEIIGNFGDSVRVIYARGGGGLLEVEDSIIKEIGESIEKEFRSKTGGSITTAWVLEEEIKGKEFDEVMRLLQLKIRRKKEEKALDIPLGTALVEEDMHKEGSICELCRKRKAVSKIKSREGETVVEIPVCETCKRKMERGKEERNNQKPARRMIEYLSSTDSERRKRIALLYGDLMNMGKTFLSQAKGGREKLRQFSNSLAKILKEELIDKLSGQDGIDTYLIPVAGGDDFFIILPEKDILKVVEKINKVNKKLIEQGFGTYFSVGFITIPAKFPFFIAYEILKKLLNTAKEESRIQGKPFLNFAYITSSGIYAQDREPMNIETFLQEIVETAKQVKEKPTPKQLLYQLAALKRFKEDKESRVEMEEIILSVAFALVRHKEHLPEKWEELLDKGEEDKTLENILEIIEIVKILDDKEGV